MLKELLATGAIATRAAALFDSTRAEGVPTDDTQLAFWTLVEVWAATEKCYPREPGSSG